MSFITDEQTVRDLEIIDRLWPLYDSCQTQGGKERIRYMLLAPSSDLEEIERRQETLQFFAREGLLLTIRQKQVDYIEGYLALHSFPVLHTRWDARWQQIKAYYQPSQAFYNLNLGILSILQLLVALQEMKEQYAGHLPDYIIDILEPLHDFYAHEKICELLQEELTDTLPAEVLHRADVQFRGLFRPKVGYVLEVVHELDALQAVAQSSQQRGFVYPVFAEASSTIDLQGFAHPSLQEPRVNSLAFREGRNGMVLTGSNMAGKSTLLRAAGLCVYLAHLGFPVPALKMTLSPLSGVLTTINLPDNPADGLSHFAQEIKRLEQIMPHLKQGRPLLLLFDELFKGTNAADAHASTVAVLERLSHFTESYFIVSTHVAGLQSALRKNEVLHFKKMETTFVAGQPVHSYRLVDGVCEDPIGFRLLQRSGVLGKED